MENLANRRSMGLPHLREMELIEANLKMADVGGNRELVGRH